MCGATTTNFPVFFLFYPSASPEWIQLDSPVGLSRSGCTFFFDRYITMFFAKPYKTYLFDKSYQSYATATN